MTAEARKQAMRDLFWLAEHCDDLAEARLRGTPRPWRQVDDDPIAREERRLRDEQERADRSTFAIGEHPAPLHVDVLDVMVGLLADADDMAERVAQTAGVERLPSPSSSFVSAEPYLRLAAAHLLAVEETDVPLLSYVAEIAAGQRAKVTSALALLATGQRLNVTCAFCHGGTEGARTLVVRESKDGDALIVCESGVCEPGEANVGAWHQGKPAWPSGPWWAWLNKVLDLAHREAS